MPSLQEFTPTQEIIDLVRATAQDDMKIAKEQGDLTICRTALGGNVDLIFDDNRILHKWQVRKWGSGQLFAGTEDQVLDFLTMNIYDAIM